MAGEHLLERQNIRDFLQDAAQRLLPGVIWPEQRNGGPLPAGNIPSEFFERALNDLAFLRNPPTLPGESPANHPREQFNSLRPSERLMDAIGSQTNDRVMPILFNDLNMAKARVG